MLNHTTGSIQIYESSAAQDNPAPAAAGAPLFAHVRDQQLQALGVPDEQYGLVRSVDSEESFYAIQTKLPRDAFEALDLVRDGCDIDEDALFLYPFSGG